MDDLTKYFYPRGEKQFGPHSLLEVESKILAGAILRSTLMWKKGMSNWLPAEEIQDIHELFDSIPPPLQLPRVPSTENARGQVKKSKKEFLSESEVFKRATASTVFFSFLLALLALNERFQIDQSDDAILFLTLILFPFIDTYLKRWIFSWRRYQIKRPGAIGLVISLVSLFTFLLIHALISGVLYEQSAVEAGCNEDAQGIIFTEYGCLTGQETIQLKLVDCQTSELYWSATGVNATAQETLNKVRQELEGHKQ